MFNYWAPYFFKLWYLLNVRIGFFYIARKNMRILNKTSGHYKLFVKHGITIFSFLVTDGGRNRSHQYQYSERIMP